MTTEGQAYPPGSGPPARKLGDGEVVAIVVSRDRGVLGALTPAGYPHLTNVLYHWDGERRIARISTTADRVKSRYLAADPRAALHVAGDDFFTYAVAEGDVTLSPVSTSPGDATGRELLALQGPFPTPEVERAFLEQMVIDRRLVLRLHVRRLYGIAIDVGG